jgi:hypothetical protein
VRQNAYDGRRVHVAVYNWARQDVVDVDLTDLLPSGTSFEVRNAQDYFGPAVLTGTYDGRPLRLPMTGLKMARPIGASNTLATAGPSFGAFIVIGHLPNPSVITNSAPRTAPIAR